MMNFFFGLGCDLSRRVDGPQSFRKQSPWQQQIQPRHYATVSPIQAFVSAYVGTGGINQSGDLTFSFANTANFDAWVPITITYPATTGISAGATVYYYRSTDGTGTWETVATTGKTFPTPTVASTVDRRDLYLPTGQFLVRVNVGGGTAAGTWSVQIGTAWVITAYG